MPRACGRSCSATGVGPDRDPGLRLRRSARLSKSDVALQDARRDTDVRNATPHRRSSAGHCRASRLTGRPPIAWISGQALTPVDMFNESAGQCVPISQHSPAATHPRTGFLPGHMDAVIDVRNLLAQGYVPVMGQDGRTVYLVQSARTVRGGVALRFNVSRWSLVFSRINMNAATNRTSLSPKLPNLVNCKIVIHRTR